MRIQVAVPEAHVHPDVIEAVAEGVTRLNEHMIRGGQTPTSHELVQAGAIWRPENPGDEHFDNGQIIAQRGWGDCDDWAPLHAATLRASGEDPGARVRVFPSGPNTYHATVQRSSGELDDPSVAAGMRPVGNLQVSGEGGIDVYACDPHDGRLYQGSLLPTVAPLSVHCGPGLTVRGCTVVGYGPIYEARCDVPLNGSPLVHVRNYYRHRAHKARRLGVVGTVPYAISCTSRAPAPHQAMFDAITGAILMGDAAEMTTSLDRYKLLAIQAAMGGMTPGQVREALIHAMTQDVQQTAAATGTDPQQHTQSLLAQLAQDGVIVGGVIVGDIFSDIAHAASGVVSAVADVAKSVTNTVGPWVGDIVHGAEAAVSLVPGIGTAISDVLATAESAYDAAAAALSGNPLQGAIDAAYNYALSTVPGGATLHFILDPVKTALENLAFKKEPIESALLDGILQDVPDAPKIGPISPRSIAGSLAHLIVDHLGVKNTGRAKTPPKPAMVAPHPAMPAAAAPRRIVPVRVAPKALPKPVAATAPKVVPLHMTPAAVKPLGVPHAAVHVSLAPALAAAQRLKPGSPGAPPGATHWTCAPQPHGQWQCKWV